MLLWVPVLHVEIWLFIVNPVAGSPRSKSSLLSVVDSNVFNLVSMVSI